MVDAEGGDDGARLTVFIVVEVTSSKDSGREEISVEVITAGGVEEGVDVGVETFEILDVDGGGIDVFGVVVEVTVGVVDGVAEGVELLELDCVVEDVI